MYNQRPKIKTYDIHPVSIKLIRSGHFWITSDKYSEKFHPKEKFIVAADRKKPFALFIHDPNHKFVRARVWSRNGNFQNQMKSFKNDLIMRLKKAITTRKKSKILEKRNHFYLVFGEGDEIPGIFIKYFNGEILIESYMDFWDQYRDFITQNTIKLLNQIYDFDIDVTNIWFQKRSAAKNPATCNDPNSTYRRVDVNEFGINYKVLIGKHYDCGIYTDMAEIRKRLKEKLKPAKSLLNLYCYTGAFSLYALHMGIKKVTSVDLSEPYLEWLNENIALNKEIDASEHQSMNMSTLEALAELIEKKVTYDFIISDPPSSSSDGNKRTNALNDYMETLPLMDKVLSDEGQMLLFLNTKKLTQDKFKNKIKSIISKNNLKLEVTNHYFLSGDCPSNKGFPEGSYLKGLLLKRKNDPSQ